MTDRDVLHNWIETVVRERILEVCADEELLVLLKIGQERGDPHYQVLGTYCFSVIEKLADYDVSTPSVGQQLKDMTEPELGEYMNRQLRIIKTLQADDVIGSMLIVFMDNGITQYGATVDPETAPDALRELADRIERRETVKR